MGLEAVELVMDVEDRFGIVIRDDEAQGVVRVRDLVALVRRKLAHTPAVLRNRPCRALASFLALRALIREVRGDATARVRPRQTVSELLDGRQRRLFWRLYSERFERTLPPLELPRSARAAGRAAALLGIVGAAWLAYLDWPRGLLAALALGLAGLIWFACQPRLATCPSADCETLRKMTQRLAASLPSDDQMPNESHLLAELRTIICKTLSVEPEHVTPDARFVEDLGLR